MREKLGCALKKEGFEPIAYEDTRPVHLNLGRVYPDCATKELAAAVENVRGAWASKTIRIKAIELILTDFVLSPVLTKNLMTFELSG